MATCNKACGARLGYREEWADEQTKPQCAPFLVSVSGADDTLRARLRYIVGTAWSTKCYMNMRPLYQPQLMQTEAVA